MALLSDPSPPRPPEAPLDAEPPAPWPWYAPFLVGIGLYVGLGVLVAGIAAAAGWTDELPDRFVIGATMAQDALLIALAYGVAAASGGHALWHLGVRRTRPGRGVLLALAVFVGFFAFLIAYQQLLGLEESDDLAQELGAEDSAANLVAVSVLVCIAAPIAEELFFRGFMFGALRKPLGWVGAAAVTGVVFGLIHAGGTDPEFLVPLAVLGAGLCWLYRMTSSLIPCMGVHAFNNALALGATLGWEGWQIATAIVVAPAVVVALATAVAVPQRPVPGAAGGTGGAAPAGGTGGDAPVFLPPIPPR